MGKIINSITFNILTCLLLLCCSSSIDNIKSIPTQFIIACGDDRIIAINPVIDITDTMTIVWDWSVKEVYDHLPEKYIDLFTPLDECKAIDNNRKLLITSSGGATGIVDIKNRNLEFYAYTPMAHSAELLPEGYIAVANSTHPKGNSLELYHRSESEKLIESDSLYSGHGVVWNNDNKLLYALGYDELRAYTFDENGSPKLNLIQIDSLPSVGGHDLSAIDSKNLLITTHENVYKYNIENRKFDIFSEMQNTPHVKSINYNPITKNIVYTKAEISWWTHNIYSKKPDKTYTIPDIDLYKVRIAP